MKPYVVLSVAMAGLGLLAAGILSLMMEKTRPAPDTTQTHAEPAAYFDAPFFMLTERSGADVTTADLDGKVWVAGFVFTRCTQGCPAVTGTMAKLQADLKLAERDDVRLVSFTVDPERDDLKSLKEYAKTYGANETKWLFLTGKEKLVRPMLKRGFKIVADKRADPKPGDEFDHSSKLYLVDKQGRVRSTFDGMQGEHDTTGERFAAEQKRLREMIAELVKE
jgi:cytochrome oxidase Cu insertion factor (SCO1/SenC/PrrC family)